MISSSSVSLIEIPPPEPPSPNSPATLSVIVLSFIFAEDSSPITIAPNWLAELLVKVLSLISTEELWMTEIAPPASIPAPSPILLVKVLLSITTSEPETCIPPVP